MVEGGAPQDHPRDQAAHRRSIPARRSPNVGTSCFLSFRKHGARSSKRIWAAGTATGDPVFIKPVSINPISIKPVSSRHNRYPRAGTHGSPDRHGSHGSHRRAQTRLDRSTRCEAVCCSFYSGREGLYTARGASFPASPFGSRRGCREDCRAGDWRAARAGPEEEDWGV